jgi:lipopolysaccharide/colanic/teichoic acid biosynthesis glycosyltransferase
LLFAFAFLGKYYFSRVVLMYFSVFAFLGFVAVRCGMALLFHSHSRHGTSRRVVILGHGSVANELARRIARHPELMCEVVGFLFPGNGDKSIHPPSDITASPGQISVPTVGVVELLQSRGVNQLVLAVPDASASELKKLVALCRKVGIGISLIPQWYELYVWKAQFSELDGLPMLSMIENRPSRLDFAVKRTMDLVLGSIFLLLTSPLLIVAGATLYLRKGCGFASEIRCGKDSRQFRMYRLNVDRDPLQLHGMERVLAQLSLTELPQLWNVLRGDMTLVGPRPESPERVRLYSDWQRQRLAVVPGLTGLAQAHGLRDQHSSEEKARFDLQYIYHWSPFFDLSLVLQTCWTLVVRLCTPAHLGLSTPGPQDAGKRPPLESPVPEVLYADRTHSCAD